jgi:DNA-binding transcriptional regulator GbsR (MarR family)
MNTKLKNYFHPELDDLSEQVGAFIQYWGFKRIHGKIWTHLFLSETPLDATTLVRRLKVSKALVSFSIRDLLEYEVIQEVARGRGRTIYYRTNPDVTSVILNVLRLRESKMLSQVMVSTKQLRATSTENLAEMKVNAEKIKELESMIGGAQGFLTGLIHLGSEQKNLFQSFQGMFQQPES